ncbi:MAG: glycosyltransferase [Candidatus Tenebribacter davisii]|nr:glycosyltransferase [Candidatus Tenebribacter davisii]
MNKRVCIIAPVHHYQDIRVYQKEAKTLSQNGYTVLLIARCDHDKIENDIQIINIKYKTRIQRFLLIPYIYYKAIKTKADFYHLHNPDTIIIGFLLKLMGRTVIYDTHEDFKKKILIRYWIPGFLKRITAMFITFLERVAGLLFDAIIVTQKSVGHRISKKALVLTNAPIKNGELFENAYQFSEGIVDQPCKRLIYVGGISSARGLKTMVQSMANLNLEYSTRLWLIGPFENNLECEKIQEIEGWEYVDYLGILPQSEAFAYMIRSDIGLVLLEDVADYSQTSANKIYEYQCFGLPFIASNFSKWVNELKKINSGLFVDASNVLEVSKKILYLLKHQDIAIEMGRNGKSYIQNEFNWENESTKLIQLYKDLV